MIRTLLATTLTAVMVTITVHAQSPEQRKIPTIPASATKDAHALATAVIEGMAGYIDAEETLEALPDKHGMPDMMQRLAATRTAQAKWRLAAEYLTRFRTSGDTVLADISQQLGDSYTFMSELYGQGIALFEGILKNTISNPAEIAIEVRKILSKSDQTIDLIVIATANLANGMIDLSRTDGAGHATYLKLTLQQKTDVTNRLKTLAGPSPEDETIDTNRSPARVPALVLWRWFSRDWYSSDEK